MGGYGSHFWSLCMLLFNTCRTEEGMVCVKVPCPDFFPDGEAERRVFFSAFAESALRTFLQRAPLDIDVSAKKKKKKKILTQVA